MKPTQALHEAGQSLWLDNITRALLDKGILARYIDEYSVTGLTSNPTIFDKAIKDGTAYDADIAARKASGASDEEVFFELAVVDLRRAANLFAPITPAPTRWTAGCRWRCPRCWPTTPRAPSIRPRACTAGPPWPTCSSRSLAPRRACPRSRSASSPRSR